MQNTQSVSECNLIDLMCLYYIVYKCILCCAEDKIYFFFSILITLLQFAQSIRNTNLSSVLIFSGHGK